MESTFLYNPREKVREHNVVVLGPSSLHHHPDAISLRRKGGKVHSHKNSSLNYNHHDDNNNNNNNNNKNNNIDNGNNSGSTMNLIPPVVIESRESREGRKRRRKRAFCRTYCVTLGIFVLLLILMEKLDEWFSLEQWVDVYPVSIQRDYSTVQSIDDLATDHVDRWCHASRSSCSCQDPLVGDGRRQNTKWWSGVHDANVEAAKTATSTMTETPAGATAAIDDNNNNNNKNSYANKNIIDVLFLGDSITEGWMGTSRGHDIARAQGAHSIFIKYFDFAHNHNADRSNNENHIRGNNHNDYHQENDENSNHNSNHSGDTTVEHDSDAKYEGLALGISGDTSPNLLWRIQNGELPETLQPKVIWLLVGTNDFGNTWCSPEVVLIGILRVVEELRVRKPESIVVINALLPRSFHYRGYVMRSGTRYFSWLGRTRPKLPSLWRDIVAVNDELRQYAASRDNVEFFETDIFFRDKDAPRERLQINSRLMPDRLHPSAEGYDLWGEQIVATLDRLIVS